MFLIHYKASGRWPIIELEDPEGGVTAELWPAAGAILNAFKIRIGEEKVNVIDGYQDQEDFRARVTKGFRSAKLSPFVCRLNRSSYSWNGVDYKLDNKFVLNGSAIHGILYDVVFDVIEAQAGQHACSVSLKYQYDGQLSGYPFPYNCTVTYTLREGGRLVIHTHISNPVGAPQSIPICDGWHPYFRLGGKVDEWFLEIASEQMMEYDGALIPTGRYVQNAGFNPGKPIGSMHLDNGFLVKEDVSPLCMLRNDRVELRFLSARNYPYLQLYIPPARDSIAIENLSAAPDAFNNGMGLYILEPGGKVDFETEISLDVLPRFS